MPCFTSQRPASQTSPIEVFQPRMPLLAYQSAPKPPEPRKLGCRTTYPRWAKNCDNQSKPHSSRAPGPPCGSTMAGRFFASVTPGGSVRYAGIIVPSAAGYEMDLTGDSVLPFNPGRAAETGERAFLSR